MNIFLLLANNIYNSLRGVKMKQKSYEFIISIVAIISIIVIILFIAINLKNSTTTLRNNSYSNSNTTNATSSLNSTKNKASNNTYETNNIDNSSLNKINSSSNNESNNNLNNNSINVESENTKEEKNLASYSTNIYDNDANRVDNIALAISKINNKIIEKDEIFSFNETVGPMDENNGFKPSTVFDSNGNIIKAPGGGMCQISSTMYCAVLEANLELVKNKRIKEETQNKQQDFLTTKIAPVAFTVWFIENYPESKRIMNENPDYQYRFK